MDTKKREKCYLKSSMKAGQGSQVPKLIRQFNLVKSNCVFDKK